MLLGKAESLFKIGIVSIIKITNTLYYFLFLKFLANRADE